MLNRLSASEREHLAMVKALEKLLGPDWQTSHREVRAEYERLRP